MFEKKKSRGSALIAETLGKFEAMISDLEGGVLDCNDTISANSYTIGQLQAVNTDLHKDCRRAEVVIGNLKELVADH